MVLYNWLQVREPIDVVKYLNRLIIEKDLETKSNSSELWRVHPDLVSDLAID